MDIKDIKDLIITMDKTSIEKVEIVKSDLKIIISKKVTNESYNVTNAIVDNLDGIYIPTRSVDEDTQEFKNINSNAENNPPLIDDESTFIVKSPIVGTFYKAANPDNPSFVKIGDRVEKGQILCIIEAMKIMNEIECESEGELIEIFVDDEDIVEYGQPLMRIRR